MDLRGRTHSRSRKFVTVDNLENHKIFLISLELTAQSFNLRCVILSSVLDSVSCPHAVPCHGEHCGAADRVDKADTVTMIMTE